MIVYHDIMTKNHDKNRRRVAEPVQVYLDPPDRTRLERLGARLVLRRGLEALERQLTDPAAHPALRIIGIAGIHSRGPAPGYDVALEHDRFLAEAEQAAWREEPGGRAPRDR